MSKAEIIICTEAGYLESLSKCLVGSFRKFAGKYKDTPIISYQPRKDHKISNETIKFFEQNNVEIVDKDLNKNYRNYPLANKPIVCAHRESVSNAEILIFLDSDVFFINEPDELFMFEDADLIIRPSDYWNIGTNNKGDINNYYWSELYKLLDVNVQRYTITTVTNRKILEYYNSGHIAALSKKGIFQQWNKNFTKVMDSGIRPMAPIFLEQSVFSATVSQMELNVKQFGKGYNYPLPHLSEILNQDYHVSDINQLVSLHYHNCFNRPLLFNTITNELLNSDKGKIINDMLFKYGVRKKFPLYSRLMAHLFMTSERKLKRLKKRLF